MVRKQVLCFNIKKFDFNHQIVMQQNKGSILSLLSFHLLFTSLLYPTNSVFSSEIVTLVANNWCPQHCLNDSGKPGYLVEIAQAALAEEGIQSTVTFEPWLRAVNDVETNKRDGLLTVAVSEQQHLPRHQEPLATQRFCFYTLNREKIQLNYLSDFRRKTIAFVKGNDLGREFMKYISDKNNGVTLHMIAPGTEEFAPRIFQFLRSGRVQGVAITEDMGDYYLGNNPEVKKQVRKGFCSPSEFLHIGLSPKNPARTRQVGRLIDSGLKKIKANGIYYNILRNYFLVDE